MTIPETDHAQINLALAEMDNVHQPSARFGDQL